MLWDIKRANCMCGDTIIMTGILGLLSWVGLIAVLINNGLNWLSKKIDNKIK